MTSLLSSSGKLSSSPCTVDVQVSVVGVAAAKAQELSGMLIVTHGALTSFGEFNGSNSGYVMILKGSKHLQSPCLKLALRGQFLRPSSMPQTASNNACKMSRAIPSLLLFGSLLFAQQATAQFDYNSTLLGTVSTFINVSTIPGDRRSLTYTKHRCYCPGCLSNRQLQQATALAHIYACTHATCLYTGKCPADIAVEALRTLLFGL